MNYQFYQEEKYWECQQDTETFVFDTEVDFGIVFRLFFWHCVKNVDIITQTRLKKCISSHRQKRAQLPTLKDLVELGFSKEQIETAVRKGFLSQLYVTLTSGAVVKVYKNPE